MKADWKAILRPTLVLTLICLLITAALAGTNLLTADRIAALAQQKQEQTMQSLVEADRFEEQQLPGDIVYYVGYRGDAPDSYVFLTEGKGYGGAVSVMTAFAPDGAVRAVAVTDVSNETPGLGQNAVHSDFTDQFAGKTAEKLTAVKHGSGSGAEDEIDALTGATFTSRAVTEAVNLARKQFRQVNTNPTGEGGAQE